MRIKGIHVLVLVLALLALSVIWLLRPEPSVPNVILISIDTLRADHLGCYGYERNTSPHLDNIAEEGILFESHFAPSSVTTPSHVSMLTSLYPLAHGVLVNSDPHSYSEDIVPIAQILKNAGFMTAGFTGGGAVSKLDGFDRGFDYWSEGQYIKSHLPDVKKWIETVKEDRFFLFFHFYDVHVPYVFRENFKDMYRDRDYYKEFISRTDRILDAEQLSLEYYSSLTQQEKFSLLVLGLIGGIKRKPEESVREAALKDISSNLKRWRTVPEFTQHIQLLVDSYDAGIRHADFYLGDFFAFLKAQNIWDNTLIIVTSDHGEEFMEHNMLSHGGHLYDTQIHIPLIIKMPRSSKQTRKRIKGLSDIVDLMPTVLDILKMDFSDQMQGQSLLPMIQGKTEKGKSRIYASMDIKKLQKMRVVRTERWKYVIHDKDFSNRDELYDFNEDPNETHNTIGDTPETMPKLKIYLADHMRECIGLYHSKYSDKRKTEENFPEELLKERMEVLRALGYIR